MRARNQTLEELKKALAALRAQRGRSLCRRAQAAYALAGRAAKRRMR